MLTLLHASVQEHLPKLHLYLGVGSLREWAVQSRKPHHIMVSYPPVRRVIVYTPGSEVCDFRDLLEPSPLDIRPSQPAELLPMTGALSSTRIAA